MPGCKKTKLNGFDEPLFEKTWKLPDMEKEN